ncbi:serine hydrolase [Nonomuraea sp. SBT364]|uniref:serine hydrolase n=1 Tax=Nonomuraea sp. SBT364 TaxID=1580530 RepID=UPI0007C74EDD|nr:serine hydrolase [Nonomuraea sp. SBT364]
MRFPVLRGAAVVAVLASVTASVPLEGVMPVEEAVPVPAAAPPAARTAEPERAARTSFGAAERKTFGAAERKRLSRALDRYLDGRAGRVSVAVRDLTTGLAFSYNTSLRPATASIVKVNLVMALLLRAQRERRRLSARERALAGRAVRVSDNDAATALWNAVGGAAGLAAANRKLGLRATAPDPGGAWGATSTSAADQVRLLRALTSDRSPLSARHRRYVLGLMKDVAPEQAWGVSAAVGGTDVALKNGWLPRPRHGGRWTVNSVGRVRGDGHDYLIAVVSERHASMGEGVKVVEKVAKTVTATLSRNS